MKRCYKKRHEGGTSKDRRSTRPENVEIENSMRRSQIGKRPKKKSRAYMAVSSAKQSLGGVVRSPRYDLLT